MLLQHVLFKIGNIYRFVIQLILGRLLLCLHINLDNTVEVVAHESEGPLALGLVRALINIVHYEHIIFNGECLRVELLAAHIPDAYIDVVTVSAVGNSTDELRLTVIENQRDVLLHVEEGDPTHRASVAHVPIGQVDCGNGIGKARSNQLFKLHIY